MLPQHRWLVASGTYRINIFFLKKGKSQPTSTLHKEIRPEVHISEPAKYGHRKISARFVSGVLGGMLVFSVC